MTSRLGIFLAVFAIMAVWELWAPARPLVMERSRRWATNLALAALDIVTLRLLMPAAAVGAAAFAAEHSIGLLPFLGLPPLLAGLIAFVALDLIVFGQHVLFHKVPVFWRLHAVHHADRDLDVTSGVRFHPLEALLSMGLKMLAVVALGAPVLAVFLFEVVLNAAAQFSHANVTLPRAIEPWVRSVIVTPEMHRTHHSVDNAETDSNYGFFLSIWDRLFGVYTAEPARGRDGLILGLDEHQNEGPARIAWSVLLPFRGPAHRD